MSDATRAAVLSWDWREQPDLDHLDQLVRDLSGGRVRIRPVYTGSDEYAIVIADGDLDDGQVADVYRRRWDDDGKTEIMEVGR